jgi:AcrR family transcriptional regulator
MPSAGAADTRERILDGAARALARYGLAKLGMEDVGESAAVSRGTVYRYFPSRAALLRMLARREGRRFEERVAEAVRRADGEERLLVALRFATEHAREHPVLRRILETDPAFVLRSLREEFPAIRAALHGLLAPLLRETRPVREGIATTDQLVDWLARVMVSAFLIPDPEPAAMARGLTAVYRMLTGAPPRRAAPRTRRGPRTGSPRGRRC